MVRTKEIARISTGDMYPPRKVAYNLVRTVTKVQTQKLLAPNPKAALKPRKTASQAAPKAASQPRKPVFEAAPKVAIQPPKPVVEAPHKRSVRLAGLKSLKTLSKQAATKTPSKQTATKTPSKQAATKTPSKKPATKTPSKQAAIKTPSKQAATKTPSKQAVTEAPSNEIDISISITCQHCKKRQKLDTEVIELCRREEKRKRNAKVRSHPEEFIDLSEEDSQQD